MTLSKGQGQQRPVFVWDMDGTLIESGPSIMRGIRDAITDCGLLDPGPEAVSRCVGPPLAESLPRWCDVPAERVDEVIATYRAGTAHAEIASAPLFDGVLDVIDAATAAGHVHAIATSKPEVVARRIVAQKGLEARFIVVDGAAGDGHHVKADIVGRCLDDLRAIGIDTRDAVMIGDRHYDMDSALAHGMRGAYAEWGYGHEPDEDRGFPRYATAHDFWNAERARF